MRATKRILTWKLWSGSSDDPKEYRLNRRGDDGLVAIASRTAGMWDVVGARGEYSGIFRQFNDANRAVRAWVRLCSPAADPKLRPTSRRRAAAVRTVPDDPLGKAVQAVERAGFAVLPTEPDDDMLKIVAAAIRRECPLADAVALRAAYGAYTAIVYHPRHALIKEDGE